MVEAGVTFTMDPATTYVKDASVLVYQRVCVVLKTRIALMVNVYAWIIGLVQHVKMLDMYVTTVVIHALDHFQLNVSYAIMVM